MLRPKPMLTVACLWATNLYFSLNALKILCLCSVFWESYNDVHLCGSVLISYAASPLNWATYPFSSGNFY